MALTRSRHVVQGSVARMVDEPRAFRALDCAHVALEVSYSTYPAMLRTIDILAEQVKPRLDG
jgi:hypothetical protein